MTTTNTHPASPMLKHKIQGLIRKLGFHEDSMLIIIAMTVGVLTGLGSIAFTWLIEVAHNFCYGSGESTGIYAGKWFYLIILPAIGALCVGTITYFFAREARGHGVPEVMDAIARKNSIIRGRVAIAKAISSALTIGSGGSAGTEGPIIQIGAALGSSIGQKLKLRKNYMTIVVGCGAAAGISAIFHAPIAGVLFALEIFLRDLKFKTFSPVLIASVMSSVTVSTVLGKNAAIFPILNSSFSFTWPETIFYILLGLICAFPAVGFTKMLYATEDLFEKKIKIHYILKPVLGAVLLGVLGIIMTNCLGDNSINEPTIFGNSYPVIGLCIQSITSSDNVINLTLVSLLALMIMKSLATCCTLGSGGSGGVFAPSLFLGAVCGYFFGIILQNTGILSEVNPANYALVGMAAVVAATTHAPMAAIMIVFEMTRDYQVMLPLMLAVTGALILAQLLYKESIYTLKLTRRGVDYQSISDKAILRNISVSQVMHKDILIVDYDTPLLDVINMAIGHEHADFVVIHEEKYIGTLNENDLRDALLQPEAVPLLVAGELTRESIPLITPDETLDKILDLFAAHAVNSLPVTENGKYIGMVTRSDMIRRYQQELNQS